MCHKSIKALFTYKLVIALLFVCCEYCWIFLLIKVLICSHGQCDIDPVHLAWFKAEDNVWLCKKISAKYGIIMAFTIKDESLLLHYCSVLSNSARFISRMWTIIVTASKSTIVFMLLWLLGSFETAPGGSLFLLISALSEPESKRTLRTLWLVLAPIVLDTSMLVEAAWIIFSMCIW